MTAPAKHGLAEHTPGPWRLKYGRATIVMPPEGIRRAAAIADCAMSHGLGDAGREDEANARLIAAAPELLALVEKWREIIGPSRSADRRRQRALDRHLEPWALEFTQEVDALLAKVRR